MIRNITVLAAGAIAAAIIAAPASASAATMTCHGTAGSKVDPISSCIATPGPVTPIVGPGEYAGRHRHGHVVATGHVAHAGGHR